MSDYEHDTIRVWIQGLDYNHCFKFRSMNELINRVRNQD